MANPWDNDPVVGGGTSPLGGRPIIRKGAEPQNKTVQNGYVIDPNTASAVPIKGLPADASGEDPGLDPKTADFYAHQVLSGGQLPALGMGKAAAKIRQQVMERVAQIGDEMGLGGADLATQQAHYKAGLASVQNLEKQRGTTQQNEETALLNGQQFIDRSAELPGQTQLPIINSVVQTAQRHLPVPGHDTIAAMDAAWNTFVNEYAKVVSGTPSGGGVLSDSARHEAMKIMQGNYSLSQKESAFAQMKADMANRLTAMNGTIDEAYKGITVQPGHRKDVAIPGLGADVNPITNGGGGDMGPSLGPSGGNTRSVVDPKKQALGEKIVGLMSQGADRNTILGFAVRSDPSLRSDPKFRSWVDDALAYRGKHPKAKFAIDPGFYTSEVPLSGQEKIGNATAQSAPGAALMNAANGVTAGNLGNITGDNEGVNRALAVAGAQHPNASLAGTMAGGTTAALGLQGALASLGVSPAIAPVAADVAYGSAAGASNGVTPGNIAKGALAGLAGNLAGRGIAKGTGAAFEGVTNPTVSYVAKDVPLTIGQAVSQSGLPGRIVKGLEDRVSGIPVIGDAVNARRLEGLQKMNSKAFDRALEPIKETAAGQFGETAVADAQDKVSNAFSKALAGKAANLDHGFIVDATKAKMGLEKLPERVRGEVNNSIDEVVNNYFDDGGQISGENMQALLRELGSIKRGYQGDPLGHRIGKVVDQFSDSVENLFRRQAPDVMPQYDAAKQAFKRVSTLEDAVLRAKNTNGVFTSGQLGMSNRANTIKFGGKHAAAAGGGEFHDFQRNMQDVLPSKVPDSGTAGRLLVPGALIAGAGGAGAANGDAEKGLTLGALLAMAYSRSGQRVLTSAVLKRGTAAKAAGQAVKKAAPLLGHAGASQAALGASRE
jgi:hypothetical protein